MSTKVKSKKTVKTDTTPKGNSISYESSGVSYNAMDPLKRLAQQEAQKTTKNLPQISSTMFEVKASRGESAYVWQEGETYRAFVIEGLGTKNRVADAMKAVTGKSYYDVVAQDTVAMIVNDLIVVGARPQVVNAYFGLGSTEWLSDQKRTADLVKGWAAACDLAGAVWGGGETPTLKGIIEPDTVDLAGSAIGYIASEKQLVLGDKLQAGDSIVLIESSGIHANGVTLARTIASSLPQGFATKLKDGTLFGEALLQPTHIYAKLVQACFEAELDIHYMVNITGHGWRKLMRANQEFTYVMNKVVPLQPLFPFIQEHSHNNDEEMYGNFNMGAGFALYLPTEHARKIEPIAKKLNLKSWIAGTVEKGPKSVVIKPKNITFSAETLGVR